MRCQSRLILLMTVVALFLTVCWAGSQPQPELIEALRVAERTYDLSESTRLLAVARQGGDPELRVQAGVVVARLLRLDFEQMPAERRAERRPLGERIDAVAEEALGLLDQVPSGAEWARARADLVATMIRSDYRARLYRDRLEEAIEEARRLEPDAPATLVVVATPLVFAPDGRGRDLSAAAELLERALELDPEHERARLLRARVYELEGDRTAAEQIYRRALEANPECRPARWRLEALGGSE